MGRTENSMHGLKIRLQRRAKVFRYITPMVRKISKGILAFYIALNIMKFTFFIQMHKIMCNIQGLTKDFFLYITGYAWKRLDLYLQLPFIVYFYYAKF